MLEMYVSANGPSASIDRIPVQHTPSNIVLPIGADPNLRDLLAIQQKRMESLDALNDRMVGEVERAVRDVRGEEARVSKWHSQKTSDLEKARRQWHVRAGELVQMRGQAQIPSRVSVEREWIELARTLPKGCARDIMEAGVPLDSRAELAQLAGGAMSESMVSRTRRQNVKYSDTQNVHWKLRHTVDDVVNNHVARVNTSAQMAIRSISSGTVRRCREALDLAKATHDANDAIVENKAQLLMQELRARGVVFEHLMGYCAEVTQRSRVSRVNRLANLLAEK